MQNQIYPSPYNQPELGHLHQIQDIDDHFNNLLSESTSRYTAAQTMFGQSTTSQQTFHSSRMFVIGTLESWGMKMGTLQYSRDNELTLKCILELISQKQRDIEHKMKFKEQINAVNFEKQKYESLVNQKQNVLAQKDKQLGKLENQCTQLRKKLKLLENQAKKEKADDQKMIYMLKSKNDQILHEIKKKQAQVTRVKQQMKRNVLAKSSTVTPHNKTNQQESPSHANTVKNSFELIEKIQRINIGQKQSKWKKNAITERSTNMNQNYYTDNFEEEKFSFMVEKYEKEKKIFLNENTLLRGKLFQVRELLVKFAEWIDVELFGQSIEQAKKLMEKKFICNHNLMFSQNALINDLNEVLIEAKNGIQQLQQRLQKTQSFIPSSKSIESPMKSNKRGVITNPSSKSINLETNTLFKKKTGSIREVGTPGKSSPFNNAKSQKNIGGSTANEFQKQLKAVHNVNRNQRQKQKVSSNQQKQQQGRLRLQQSTHLRTHNARSPPPNAKPSIFLSQQLSHQDQYSSQQLPSQIRPSKSNYINELQLSAFENDLLSDIHQHSGYSDPDNSIVSHISASQLLKEVEKGGQKGGKYDKWDILFRTEGDQEEQ